LTAGYPEGANLPVHFDTDREAIEAALAIIGNRPPENAHVMRIRNTLAVEELDVSVPCLEKGKRCSEFSAIGQARELEFDSRGDLI
jgi:hypothetical protein